MDMNENAQQELLPEYLTTSGIDLWEPDVLYAEWLGFLDGIWKRVDYL